MNELPPDVDFDFIFGANIDTSTNNPTFCTRVDPEEQQCAPSVSEVRMLLEDRLILCTYATHCMYAYATHSIYAYVTCASAYYYILLVPFENMLLQRRKYGYTTQNCASCSLHIYLCNSFHIYYYILLVPFENMLLHTIKFCTQVDPIDQ